MKPVKLTIPLLALIFMSILIIPSTFFGPKVAGVALLLYVIILGWNMNSLVNAGVKRKKSRLHILGFPFAIAGSVLIMMQIFWLIFFA